MVPGIVARDEGSGSSLRFIRFITSSFDIRRQTDAPINLHAAIGRDSDSLIEFFITGFFVITAFFASPILGISAAEHRADYCRNWILMASLCRKEEVRVAVAAKDIAVVGVMILGLTVATIGEMRDAIVAGIVPGVGFRLFLIFGRSITKNRRAVGACHQGLTRRANRNATTVATGRIAAYIGVIDK